MSTKKFIAALLLIIFVLTLIYPGVPPANAAEGEVIVFPDPVVEKAVRRYLNKSTGPLTTTDLETLLNLHMNDPSDLSGLEYAVNLRSLSFSYGTVTDFTPIENLTNIEHLGISSSNLDDISFIQNMTKLWYLNLDNNNLRDVSPLSGLINLSNVFLRENQIEDISGLANITGGGKPSISIYLNDNNISDISPLSGLPKLRLLNLNNNQIEDISPLGNVQVYDLKLNNNKITDISPLVNMTDLGILEANNNFIVDASPLSGLPYLDSLRLENNRISSFPPADGKFESVYLSGNQLRNLDFLQYQSTQIGLSILDVSNNLLEDISALQKVQDIRTLKLENNLIEDISALQHLNGIDFLELNGNKITDISPIAQHRPVNLGLGENNISDIFPLSGMTSLESLQLNDNQIDNITPLGDLIKLKYLNLSNNNLSDVSLLGNLIWLKSLYLDGNQITDAGFIHKFQALYDLSLNYNQISDASPFRYSILKTLHLRGNYLTDIYPLQYIYKPEAVDLRDNPLVLFPGSPAMTIVEILIEKGADVQFGEITEDDGNLYFRDTALEDALRDFLNIQDRPLTRADLEPITELDLSHRGIKDIYELRYCPNLTNLNLSGDNNFSDVAPLSLLTKLEELNLAGVPVPNINALSNLKNLRRLNINACDLSDAQVLLELPNLEWVDMSNSWLRSNIRPQIRELKTRRVVVLHRPYPYEHTNRLWGQNRYSTAMYISLEGWDSAETIILARGDEYADALAGAPLAYKLNAPILLTNTRTLSPEVALEVRRLGAAKVIILGGTAAVSLSVESELNELGMEVQRISGLNRYATAAEIAARVAPDGVSTAIIAYGKNFPDALSAATYAARNGYPILLTENSQLPTETAEALTALNTQETVVVGGSAVIGEKVLDSLPGPTRVKGSNRYATSVALAEHFTPQSERVFIATGKNFADAVTGAVLAAKMDSPLLLVDKVEPYISDFVLEHGFSTITAFGGVSAISDSTLMQISEYRFQSPY